MFFILIFFLFEWPQNIFEWILLDMIITYSIAYIGTCIHGHYIQLFKTGKITAISLT